MVQITVHQKGKSEVDTHGRRVGRVLALLRLIPMIIQLNVTSQLEIKLKLFTFAEK